MLDRFLQITTPLGENELTLTEFSGTEAVSTLFQFNLVMTSADTGITPDKLLGKSVSIQLNTNPDAEPRYFHGMINQFSAGNIIHDIRYYYAAISPWLYFLTHISDCRVFQNKNVIDITKLIFNEFGFADYNTIGLTKQYPPRGYCVQYRETTLTFLQRLWQEEGIFYYFKHETSKHTLILADKNTAFVTCENKIVFDSGSQKNNGLTSWGRHYAFYSGQYQQMDFNYQQPGTSLLTQQQSTAKLSAARKYSLYNYPGGYQTSTVGKTYTQQYFEAQEAEHDVVHGGGNYCNFTAGGKFNLSNAPTASDGGDYLLLSVSHYAKDESYCNDFTGIPAAVTYRPPAIFSKPIIAGAQTAIVVGPADEELYTDVHGRVKVQFHWDRQGKKNDRSSCWVRVAQNLAGNQWGTLFLPRIGQEVVVQFLDGDPDQPIITGAVYNAHHLTPFELPAQQTRSGVKTYSTNQLYFEDKPGHEEIYLFSPKDLNLQALNSINLKVSGNSVLINTEGIFLNGAKVNINT